MAILSAILAPQDWPASVYVLLATLVSYAFVRVLSKPPFPAGSPPLVKGYPIVGVPAFFSARNALFKLGSTISKTGNFSFYLGKIPIVGMSGEVARKAYFDSKELNLAKGYERLFADGPSLEDGTDDFGSLFNRNIKTLLLRENFVRNLNLLSADVRACFKTLVAREKRVMDPYEDVYRLVYQLTMRTLGCHEIAESKKLGDETLALYEAAENGTSPARFIIPWLPTPAHIRRVASGTRLYMILDGIIKERRRTGTRRDDALQVLLDQQVSVLGVIEFIMGSLFSGQLNTSINAAALMVYLAQNPEWMAKIKGEVDGVVNKYRVHGDESAIDVLGKLGLDAWESEFPLVDIALKETIRIELVGSSYRMNDSGKPMNIHGTGEIVPAGAFSVYQMDDVHMNSDIYPEPLRWDPGRFLPERAEDKKQVHGFIGWGAGRHPCLGMKFAKLEIFLITAHFISMFDFQLSDKDGNLDPDTPVLKDRSRFTAHKPSVPVYFRYQVR